MSWILLTALVTTGGAQMDIMQQEQHTAQPVAYLYSMRPLGHSHDCYTGCIGPCRFTSSGYTPGIAQLLFEHVRIDVDAVDAV